MLHLDFLLFCCIILESLSEFSIWGSSLVVVCKNGRVCQKTEDGVVPTLSPGAGGARGSGRLFAQSTNQHTNTINYQIKVSHPCSMFLNIANICVKLLPT